MTAIQIFESPEFGNMRITDRNGQEWYCSADVCRACGIANPSQAISRLDEDEKITLTFNEGNPRAGIPHSLTFVSEAGLYALILTSTKPEAKTFKRWITHEVIPSIRKTGFYVSTKELHRRDEIIDRLEDELHLLRQPVGNVERIGVSVPQAANMAGVSVTGILPYIKDGTIRTVRFGKRMIVSVQSIRDYIDGKEMPRDPIEMEISKDESRSGEEERYSTTQ